ncbi:MAG: RNA-binding protein [Nitrososphaeria archaeon]|nr:RNA-binding protein [Nitrososphaeria archaeon]MDW8043603.1 RNA-binding protein [Nitrososphaerota archaeon]
MSSRTLKTDVIIVGRKPVLRYVLATITSLNRGSEEVIVRGRGRSVSKCVDVVMTLKRSFYRDLEIKGISLGTDEVKVGDHTINLSYIEVRIGRSRPAGAR